MKLTDRILLSALKKQFHMKETKHIGTSKSVGGPLLYEKGEIAESGWVYVAENADELEAVRIPDNCFWVFLSGTRIPEDCCGVLLETKERMSFVLNSIRKIFSYYEKWVDGMQKNVDNQGDVQGLLKESLPICQTPLLVIGSDFDIHFVASTPPIAKEYPIFGAGKDRMDVVNAFTQDKIFSEGSKSEHPFWIPEYLIGHRGVCVNLWKDNRVSYRLIALEYHNRLGREHEDFLQILAPFVASILYKANEGRREEENLPKIFRQILTDRSLDYMEASQKLAAFGWQRQHDYLCLVYKVTYLDWKRYSVNAICHHMEANFPGCCSFIYKEDVVNFFNLSLGELDEEEMEVRLKPFIRDSFLKAGYSRVMKGHMNLRRQYVQSYLALDVGSRKRPHIWIHHFNQIALPYILEQITKKLPGDMICHEKLLLLKQMDEENGTEYMKTLKMYLDLHQNAVQSAKELYIHRSTFLYRLDKIKSILESDLEDSEELLYLELSFRLLEQEE